MAGFEDLIAEAMPYLAREEMEATQDTTWRWGYIVTDFDKALVDLTVGFTGSCAIRVKNGDTDAVTMTVTFPVAGQILCAADPPDNDEVPVGVYFHEVTVTRDSDGAQIVVVGSGDSRIGVKKKIGFEAGS